MWQEWEPKRQKGAAPDAGGGSVPEGTAEKEQPLCCQKLQRCHLNSARGEDAATPAPFQGLQGHHTQETTPGQLEGASRLKSGGAGFTSLAGPEYHPACSCDPSEKGRAERPQVESLTLRTWTPCLTAGPGSLAARSRSTAVGRNADSQALWQDLLNQELVSMSPQRFSCILRFGKKALLHTTQINSCSPTKLRLNQQTFTSCVILAELLKLSGSQFLMQNPHNTYFTRFLLGVN